MKVQQSLLAFFLSVFLVFPLQAAIFKDFSGKPVSIDDYTGKGRWVVVMIWASDCHVCNREAAGYNAFHEKHQASDAMVLGLSMDGKSNLEAARSFVKRHKLKFPNLIGEPLDVTIRFSELTGVEWAGTPSFLIYAPDGTLAVQQIGAVPVELIEAFIKQQQKAR